MKPIANLDLLKTSLSQTKKAIVILGANPNFDTTAAALGFALALKKQGISAQVVSPTPMRVEFSRLVGVDEVKSKIGNRNLVVSFAYNENQVEKVSYQISEDGKRFNLVIAPKSGSLPLAPETVEFDLAGAEAEFITTFGVNSREEFEEIFKNEHGILDTAMTLGFTVFPAPTFAKCQADAQGLSCLSELAANACDALGLEFDEDSGSNLLAGIDLTTNGFRSPLVSADTFEVIALLMRSGAVRPPVINIPPMTPAQMPFRPVQNIPVQSSNDQFAKMLAQSPVQITGEFKG